MGRQMNPAVSYAARAGAWPGSPPVSTTAMSIPRLRMCAVANSVSRELNTATLIVRIDANDVDDAYPLMERVQCDGDETNGTSIHNGDEDVTFSIRTTRSDRV